VGRRVEKKGAATHADLAALPPGVVGELVDGTLYSSPRPSSLHARAAGRLLEDLGAPFDRGRGGPGGWIILVEPELHLGGAALVPDLAGWRRARMPELPDVAAFDLAPDWICEVISPSTAVLDRKIKLPRYAEAGIGHAWLVDPVAQLLEVLAREGSGWRTLAVFGERDPVRAEPFETFTLDLGALWER
jgi:Uma2 family endonuclease